MRTGRSRRWRRRQVECRRGHSCHETSQIERSESFVCITLTTFAWIPPVHGSARYGELCSISSSSPNTVRGVAKPFKSNSPTGGGTASELFIEGIFPAASGGASINDLVMIGNFSRALRDQLARADAHMTDRPLYKHQKDAIELASRPTPARPVVVVRAGTGMGKTEAFLLPLLNELYSRPRPGAADGVRAIVLYPMNALVNDQVQRLQPRVRTHASAT